MSERESGQLVTLDAATGKLAWSGQARFSTNAALLEGGPVLLVVTTDADLLVFKKGGAALMPLARYQVAESPTWASPAVTGNRILIKDLASLSLYDIPG
jgi:hypothetical protein